MSRSGYTDDCYDDWELALYRGQVASTIRGKRGQAFLKEMLEALDTMPEKKLIAHELRCADGVCAIGSVGAKRGVELEKLDPEDPYRIADAFGISQQLVSEIEYMNDEASNRFKEDPGERWKRMRAWVFSQIKEDRLCKVSAL